MLAPDNEFDGNLRDWIAAAGATAKRGAHVFADWLPTRAHDALNRLLRTHAVCTRTLMQALIS
jgi:hypothetical protein